VGISDFCLKDPTLHQYTTQRSGTIIQQHHQLHLVLKSWRTLIFLRDQADFNRLQTIVSIYTRASNALLKKKKKKRFSLLKKKYINAKRLILPLYAISGDAKQKYQRVKTDNKIPQWMRRLMAREYTKRREEETGDDAEMVAMTNSKKEEEQKGKWAFGEVERNERLLFHIVICIRWRNRGGLDQESGGFMVMMEK
jgi:hypothetical protein